MANTRQYLVLAGLVVVGLLLIVLQQSLGITHWATGYLNAISSTLLMGGLLGVLYKKYIDDEHYRELKKMLRIHESIEDSGLLEYHKKSNDFNYSHLVTDSKELTVVVNDGHKWVTINANDLRERFNRKTTTRFIHLDGSNPFVEALVSKTGYERSEFTSKLDTARTELIKIYEESNKKGTLEIYAMETYPTHSIYLTDKKLVITPYQISSKRLNIPVYVYDATNSDRGYFKDVKIDLEHIVSDAKVVFPVPDNDVTSQSTRTQQSCAGV